MNPTGKSEQEETYPLGIKFWVEVDKSSVPHIRVYKCMGGSYSGTFFVFEAMRDPKRIIFKTLDELIFQQSKFKPFLLDLEMIRKNYGQF